jgi:hypothetical protein
MKAKLFICLWAAFAFVAPLRAQQQQQVYDVTDTQPAEVNGITMGYHINSEEVKKVSDKGDFSRFSVKFFVTNTSPESKIILYRTGFILLNEIAPYIVQFDVLNATGARFTSKQATLQANPCTVLAHVDDKDPKDPNKPVKAKRFVDIGYWIKAGETISATAIVIVPLNEKPKITATYLMNAGSPVGTVLNSQNTGVLPPPPPVSYGFNRGSFYAIRNSWKGTYVDNRAGFLSTNNTDQTHVSLQWEIIPVNGANYYIIKAKGMYTCLSSGKPGTVELNTNTQYAGSMWYIEPVPNSDRVRIRNVGNSTYLNMESGALQSTAIWDDAESSRWVLEGGR